jgi:hypothetical protein
MARKAGELRPVMARIPEGLRRRLARAASAVPRSMNAEMVHRLQRSFDDDQRLEEVWGSREVYGLMRIIAEAIQRTGQSAGFYSTRTVEGAEGWLTQPWAYDQAKQAAMRVLEALRPPGDPTAPAPELSTLGRGFASGVLNDIARGTPRVINPDNVERLDELRSDLGSLAERLTEADTMKEDLLHTVYRDDVGQATFRLNKKPEGEQS